MKEILWAMASRTSLPYTGRAQNLGMARRWIQWIGLIPVTSPPVLRIQGPSFVARSIDSVAGGWVVRKDLRLFTQRMEGARHALGNKLTLSLLETLPAQGFEVCTDKYFRYHAYDPERSDGTLPARAGLLMVAFSEVGISFAHRNGGFLPRMNVRAYLKANADSKSCLTGDHFFYGADARGDMAWTIPADPRYCYPTFEALIHKTSELAESYDIAVRVIARRIAEQLRAQV